MKGVLMTKMVQELNLTNLTPDIDLSDKRIITTEINRPALQLTGYLEHFANERVQIIGYVEYTYLMQLPDDKRLMKYERFISSQIPCVIFSTMTKPSEDMLNLAKEYNVPIRIGVNSGSIEKKILEKYGKPTADGMVESAMYHVGLLEKFDFHNIVISLKASNVQMMVEAYRKIAELVDYPLHLGVTEAGTAFQGTVKSAIGIGSLLADGIGDTIRVSLTENPVEEIKVAKEILKVLGMRQGVEIISCPTCGRTEIDLINLAKKVEKEFGNMERNIKIAVMGCIVNGPGEAKEADYGVAGGKGVGLLFKKGEIIKKVKEEDIISELRAMIEGE